MKAMERVEWLRQMRAMAEAFYDHISPLYGVRFGLHSDETHQEFVRELLERLAPRSRVLSSACGAGRFDGMLVEAGHSVLGIDQSEGMLARASERCPEARYERLGLQEIDFRQAFDGATCIDAMEHINPEDWPVILQRLRDALRPGGVLYLTVDPGGEYVEGAYQRAKALGLPVVYGEVADKVEENYRFFMSYEDVFAIPDDALRERADSAVYHYNPSLEQVRAWLGQAGLAIEKEATGPGWESWVGYEHFVLRRG